ncbi:MAG: hypothetical protein LBQ47_07260, partial [Endomicrobium sp.]|nr:hypothetical protein [Endomicrobium sp.]
PLQQEETSADISIDDLARQMAQALYGSVDETRLAGQLKFANKLADGYVMALATAGGKSLGSIISMLKVLQNNKQAGKSDNFIYFTSKTPELISKARSELITVFERFREESEKDSKNPLINFLIDLQKQEQEQDKKTKDGYKVRTKIGFIDDNNKTQGKVYDFITGQETTVSIKELYDQSLFVYGSFEGLTWTKQADDVAVNTEDIIIKRKYNLFADEAQFLKDLSKISTSGNETDTEAGNFSSIVDFTVELLMGSKTKKNSFTPSDFSLHESKEPHISDRYFFNKKFNESYKEAKERLKGAGVSLSRMQWQQMLQDAATAVYTYHEGVKYTVGKDEKGYDKIFIETQSGNFSAVQKLSRLQGFLEAKIIIDANKEVAKGNFEHRTQYTLESGSITGDNATKYADSVHMFTGSVYEAQILADSIGKNFESLDGAGSKASLLRNTVYSNFIEQMDDETRRFVKSFFKYFTNDKGKPNHTLILSVDSMNRVPMYFSSILSYINDFTSSESGVKIHIDGFSGFDESIKQQIKEFDEAKKTFESNIAGMSKIEWEQKYAQEYNALYEKANELFLLFRGLNQTTAEQIKGEIRNLEGIVTILGDTELVKKYKNEKSNLEKTLDKLKKTLDKLKAEGKSLEYLQKIKEFSNLEERINFLDNILEKDLEQRKKELSDKQRDLAILPVAKLMLSALYEDSDIDTLLQNAGKTPVMAIVTKYATTGTDIKVERNGAVEAVSVFQTNNKASEEDNYQAISRGSRNAENPGFAEDSINIDDFLDDLSVDKNREYLAQLKQLAQEAKEKREKSLEEAKKIIRTLLGETNIEITLAIEAITDFEDIYIFGDNLNETAKEAYLGKLADSLKGIKNKHADRFNADFQEDTVDTASDNVQNLMLLSYENSANNYNEANPVNDSRGFYRRDRDSSKTLSFIRYILSEKNLQKKNSRFAANREDEKFRRETPKYKYKSPWALKEAIKQTYMSKWEWLKSLSSRKYSQEEITQIEEAGKHIKEYINNKKNASEIDLSVEEYIKYLAECDLDSLQEKETRLKQLIETSRKTKADLDAKLEKDLQKYSGNDDSGSLKEKSILIETSLATKADLDAKLHEDLQSYLANLEDYEVGEKYIDFQRLKAAGRYAKIHIGEDSEDFAKNNLSKIEELEFNIIIWERIFKPRIDKLEGELKDKAIKDIQEKLLSGNNKEIEDLRKLTAAFIKNLFDKLSDVEAGQRYLEYQRTKIIRGLNTEYAKEKSKYEQESSKLQMLYSSSKFRAQVRSLTQSLEGAKARLFNSVFNGKIQAKDAELRQNLQKIFDGIYAQAQERHNENININSKDSPAAKELDSKASSVVKESDSKDLSAAKELDSKDSSVVKESDSKDSIAVKEPEFNRPIPIRINTKKAPSQNKAAKVFAKIIDFLFQFAPLVFLALSAGAVVGIVALIGSISALSLPVILIIGGISVLLLGVNAYYKKSYTDRYIAYKQQKEGYENASVEFASTGDRSLLKKASIGLLYKIAASASGIGYSGAAIALVVGAAMIYAGGAVVSLGIIALIGAAVFSLFGLIANFMVAQINKKSIDKEAVSSGKESPAKAAENFISAIGAFSTASIIALVLTSIFGLSLLPAVSIGAIAAVPLYFLVNYILPSKVSKEAEASLSLEAQRSNSIGKFFKLFKQGNIWPILLLGAGVGAGLFAAIFIGSVSIALVGQILMTAFWAFWAYKIMIDIKDASVSAKSFTGGLWIAGKNIWAGIVSKPATLIMVIPTTIFLFKIAPAVVVIGGLLLLGFAFMGFEENKKIDRVLFFIISVISALIGATRPANAGVSNETEVLNSFTNSQLDNISNLTQQLSAAESAADEELILSQNVDESRHLQELIEDEKKNNAQEFSSLGEDQIIKSEKDLAFMKANEAKKVIGEFENIIAILQNEYDAKKAAGASETDLKETQKKLETAKSQLERMKTSSYVLQKVFDSIDGQVSEDLSKFTQEDANIIYGIQSALIQARDNVASIKAKQAAAAFSAPVSVFTAANEAVSAYTPSPLLFNADQEAKSESELAEAENRVKSLENYSLAIRELQAENKPLTEENINDKHTKIYMKEQAARIKEQLGDQQAASILSMLGMDMQEQSSTETAAPAVVPAPEPTVDEGQRYKNALQRHKEFRDRFLAVITSGEVPFTRAQAEASNIPELQDTYKAFSDALYQFSQISDPRSTYKEVYASNLAISNILAGVNKGIETLKKEIENEKNESKKEELNNKLNIALRNQDTIFQVHTAGSKILLSMETTPDADSITVADIADGQSLSIVNSAAQSVLAVIGIKDNEARKNALSDYSISLALKMDGDGRVAPAPVEIKNGQLVTPMSAVSSALGADYKGYAMPLEDVSSRALNKIGDKAVLHFFTNEADKQSGLGYFITLAREKDGIYAYYGLNGEKQKVKDLLTLLRQFGYGEMSAKDEVNILSSKSIEVASALDEDALKSIKGYDGNIDITKVMKGYQESLNEDYQKFLRNIAKRLAETSETTSAASKETASNQFETEKPQAEDAINYAGSLSQILGINTQQINAGLTDAAAAKGVSLAVQNGAVITPLGVVLDFINGNEAGKYQAYEFDSEALNQALNLEDSSVVLHVSPAIGHYISVKTVDDLTATVEDLGRVVSVKKSDLASYLAQNYGWTKGAAFTNVFFGVGAPIENIDDYDSRQRSDAANIALAQLKTYIANNESVKDWLNKNNQNNDEQLKIDLQTAGNDARALFDSYNANSLAAQSQDMSADLSIHPAVVSADTEQRRLEQLIKNGEVMQDNNGMYYRVIDATSGKRGAKSASQNMFAAMQNAPYRGVFGQSGSAANALLDNLKDGRENLQEFLQKNPYVVSTLAFVETYAKEQGPEAIASFVEQVQKYNDWYYRAKQGYAVADNIAFGQPFAAFNNKWDWNAPFSEIVPIASFLTFMNNVFDYIEENDGNNARLQMDKLKGLMTDKANGNLKVNDPRFQYFSAYFQSDKGDASEPAMRSLLEANGNNAELTFDRLVFGFIFESKEFKDLPRNYTMSDSMRKELLDSFDIKTDAIRLIDAQTGETLGWDLGEWERKILEKKDFQKKILMDVLRHSKDRIVSKSDYLKIARLSSEIPSVFLGVTQNTDLILNAGASGTFGRGNASANANMEIPVISELFLREDGFGQTAYRSLKKILSTGYSQEEINLVIRKIESLNADGPLELDETDLNLLNQAYKDAKTDPIKVGLENAVFANYRISSLSKDLSERLTEVMKKSLENKNESDRRT